MAKKQTNTQTENQELLEMKQNYLRALADYQNLERRVGEQTISVRKNATKQLLIQLLDIVDDIDRAEVFIQDQGLSHVKTKLHKILEGEGVVAIETIGKDFDPYIAECIELVEGQENKVIKELQKGYYLGQDVLRTAKVAVGKAS